MFKQPFVPVRSRFGRTAVARRLVLPAVAALLAVAGSDLAAQKNPYPIFSLDNLVNTMKTMGRNFAGANDSIAKGDFETAKSQLIRAREQLAVSITFWRDNKKDDAIAVLRETLKKFDDVDTALSAEKVDAPAVTALARQIGAGCQTCHSKYRDQDPATKQFRVKPGTVTQ